MDDLFFLQNFMTVTEKLQPRGCVIEIGLHPPLSKTASHVSECFRLRSAPNRLMSHFNN